MSEELSFKDKAAAEYDRAFAHVTAHFMSFLLRAADVAPGMRVLAVLSPRGVDAATRVQHSATATMQQARGSR